MFHKLILKKICNKLILNKLNIRYHLISLIGGTIKLLVASHFNVKVVNKIYFFAILNFLFHHNNIWCRRALAMGHDVIFFFFFSFLMWLLSDSHPQRLGWKEEWNDWRRMLVRKWNIIVELKCEWQKRKKQRERGK